MNSPDESPSMSDTSADTPPPEDGFLLEGSSAGDFAQGSSSTLGQGPSLSAKRRNFSGKSGRDSKAVRRENSQRVMVGGSGAWDKESGPREKDLVDNQWVEWLRKEIGDPFATATTAK
ncbi:hypothetical protein CYLTODRAFT_493064 [Cylindrobasidium torrendii FP15055 ss-10]|uniref:Uncharacterized protein n=1 Tax=Cylindrobasidium torrendii FP15055 ss-10 TaxID=1314674 RepID=A0A0D7B202_9AGAR|nr:hypothetical protein CYLTODRAFT_493064 [Cylindrobasidium torrendii FP15055 ss-10]